MLKTISNSVKLEDVAARAGIAVATASRALNGKGRMSSATRETVLKAAQELGYQPDRFAQRLVQGRSHNIIAHLSDYDLGVLSRQAFFINHRLRELSFEVQLHTTPRYIPETEAAQFALANNVRRQRPGAVICGSSLVANAFQELQLFMQEGGVVVGYGQSIELECDQVIFDLVDRAYLATRHLLELGHRELGFCIHGPDLQDSGELIGFRRAMEEFGAPIQEDWLFVGGNYEEGGARLAEAFLKWPKKPTGICIVNDVSASAFITILVRSGVSVPGDVSVVGFDDAPAARYAFVPLTSANYPLETIGRHVVELVQSRLGGYDGPPRKVVIQSELIVRASTAPFKSKGRSRT
ncbi:MAG TPA: LacI family DNA-binding transcriptional regulator [Abditibacteriaceae bacterium]|jgi:DNA-binding LacI/PurR family transcriptional regulator